VADGPPHFTQPTKVDHETAVNRIGGSECRLHRTYT
jgi:hypothetical protein